MKLCSLLLLLVLDSHILNAFRHSLNKNIRGQLGQFKYNTRNVDNSRCRKYLAINSEESTEIVATDESEFEDDSVEVVDDIVNFLQNATDTPANDETAVIDPKLEAVKDKINFLNNQIVHLEHQVSSERLHLLRIKDKVSESGKTGFFMVQAQVADFMKKKDVEQQKRVKSNKREFVSKMLPVIDLFRKAPELAPATTEKEENMHKTFGSLLNGFITLFEKFGYKEFNAEIGSKYDPSKHETVEVVSHVGTEGVVLEQRRVGVVDAEGDVLRRAQVVISKATPQVETPAPEVASANDSHGEDSEFPGPPIGEDDEELSE